MPFWSQPLFFRFARLHNALKPPRPHRERYVRVRLESLRRGCAAKYKAVSLGLNPPPAAPRADWRCFHATDGTTSPWPVGLRPGFATQIARHDAKLRGVPNGFAQPTSERAGARSCN